MAGLWRSRRGAVGSHEGEAGRGQFTRAWEAGARDYTVCANFSGKSRVLRRKRQNVIHVFLFIFLSNFYWSLVGLQELPRWLSGKEPARQHKRFGFYPWIRKIPWRRAQLSGKEPACQRKRLRFYPWIRKIPWRRAQQPTPVFLPGESHGQKSLARYSPWGHRRAGHTLAVTVLSACCTVK